MKIKQVVELFEQCIKKSVNFIVSLNHLIMHNLLDRIIIDPDICNGKPTIRGLRITVKTVLEYLAAGESIENILEAYPLLEREDIFAAMQYAAKISDHAVVAKSA